MDRKIKKILISTMPRSGTVFLFNFISELFGYSKLEPVFTGGLKPESPEWDPYKFDKTYAALSDSQVLCAHYPLTDDVKSLISQPDVLAMYLYRDPRDAAVSAALYIKNVLTHHPLHRLFSELSDSESIAFMLGGGVLVTGGGSFDSECDYINHEGMEYFCDSALRWLAEPDVATIRYEEFVHDPVGCLKVSLRMVGVEVDEAKALDVAAKLNFATFSNGRTNGEENVKSHFRKGIAGDFVNHFNGLHKAICKRRIGQHLIALGYEKNMCW